MISKQFSAACERNSAPILEKLRETFADRRKILEIGSGTGQHAVFFAKHLPHLIWQSSDLARNHPGILAWLRESGLANVRPPLLLDMRTHDWPSENFDAVFSANTCHIMAWPDVLNMFAGIGQLLPAGGKAAVYGPFKYQGRFTSAGNAQFDATLRAQASHMGIRDIEAITAAANAAGLVLAHDYDLPANNRLLIWHRI